MYDEKEELLEAALNFVKDGCEVLPLQGSALLHGVRVTDATSRPSTIRQWLRDERVDGIGLATGKLFFVLDLNNKNICLGEAGQLPDDGYTVYTPSGGKHYYFTPSIGSTVGCFDNLTPDLSVIGTGGYVAVPPSPGYNFAHKGEPPIVYGPSWLQTLIGDETRNYLRKRVKPLLSGDVEPIEYVVEGLVPKAGIGLIAGPSGCGKTTLLVSMAIAVSQGLSWCGLQTIQTPVVFFDRENNQATARDMLIRHGCVDESSLCYYGRWNDSRVPDIADILRMPVVTQKPLFIFDSFSRFHKGDENSAKDVRETFDQLRQLADAGCTVLVIHHTGKAEGSQYRGSSDIEAAVDFAYEVSATKNGGYLNTIKLENFKFRNECVQKKALKVNQTGALEPLAFAEKKASVDDALTQLLADNPGITATEFVTQSGINRRKVDAWREQNKEFITVETKGRVRYLTLKPK